MGEFPVTTNAKALDKNSPTQNKTRFSFWEMFKRHKTWRAQDVRLLKCEPHLDGLVDPGNDEGEKS